MMSQLNLFWKNFIKESDGFAMIKNDHQKRKTMIKKIIKFKVHMNQNYVKLVDWASVIKYQQNQNIKLYYNDNKKNRQFFYAVLFKDKQKQ